MYFDKTSKCICYVQVEIYSTKLVHVSICILIKLPNVYVMYKLRFCTSCNLYKQFVQVATCTRLAVQVVTCTEFHPQIKV